MTTTGMWGSSGRVLASQARRNVALRCVALGLMVAGYRVSFSPLHGIVGNSAFLVGLIPCVAAPLLLGLRGALVIVFVVGRAQGITRAITPLTPARRRE